MGLLKDLLNNLIQINKNQTIHELKTWPIWFEPTLKGIKNFEVRKNDRNYKFGDLLRLKEWDPDKLEYTGRETVVTVKYILFGGQLGIDDNYIVMSIE